MSIYNYICQNKFKICDSVLKNNMKRKNIFLCLLILIIGFGKVKAQEENQGDTVLREYPTGYIALNVGVGTATGNFAKKEIGSALSGNAFQLSVCVPFESSYFGLAGKVNYGTYAMSDQTFYMQQMSVNKKFGLDTTVKFSPSIKQNYVQTSLLIGICGNLPIITDERLSLDARVLFGPTIINRPALSIDSIGGVGYTTTYTQAASKSSSFAYDFGFGIRYNLLKSKRLCVMLNFDYIKTKANFELESNSKYLDDSDNMVEGIHTEKIIYSISSYDITAGIGYVW